MATTLRNKIPASATPDISGKDHSIVVKSWFFVGCAFMLFMAYVPCRASSAMSPPA